MGIAIAVPVAIQEDEHAIAPFGKEFENLQFPGLILVAIVFALLYRWSLRSTPAAGHKQ
jgi:hypothetical protein